LKLSFMSRDLLDRSTMSGTLGGCRLRVVHG
jgi:hypothetical protein